ncbi:hypothetical protein [Imperialibacter roseus]|uniref:Uncharacterized protein n=1 Tax=Imperialibacter roseus TaxID=1324217 RepID=A0ABZ0IS11_9BACT|nr:hypothetical protein [Imperialibacter roseus]WOK07160.1 hypothetical protein RT717_00810 [Imperialibacter roseus]
MINNPNYPLRSLGLFILPLVVCLGLMRSVSLPNEKALQPYKSLIIALEFVHSSSDVVNTLEVLDKEEILGLDRVNYFDFVFMAVYSSFLAFFIYKLGVVSNQPLVKSMAWAGLVIFSSDLLENIMMLRITSGYMEGGMSFSPYINFLPLFTWAKWGLLAAVFAWLGTLLIQKGSLSKMLSLILFLPGILLALSVVDYFSWINRFTTSIFLAFIILLIFAVCFRKTEQYKA